MLQVALVDGKADVKDEDDKKVEKKETQAEDTKEERNEDQKLVVSVASEQDSEFTSDVIIPVM